MFSIPFLLVQKSWNFVGSLFSAKPSTVNIDFGATIGSVRPSRRELHRMGIKELSKTPFIRRTKRDVQAFNTNHTMSRGEIADKTATTHPCHVDLTADPVQWGELTDKIEDHANRRVLLFYYLLVIYHDEKCHIEMDKTLLQHGTASCGQCQAAHSSIITNLKDDYIPLLTDLIHTEGLSSEALRKLELLGVEEKKFGPRNSRAKIRSILQSLEGHEPRLLQHVTHFYHNMNATIEVAKEVNSFDCLIEGIMRPKAMKILNQVSMGELDPIAGLTQFLRAMSSFFETAQKSIQQKNNLLPALVDHETKVLEAENEFKEEDSLTNFTAYLNTLIDLRAHQKKINAFNMFSPPLTPKNRLPSHEVIYDEIYRIYYEEKSKVELSSDLNYLRRYLSRLIQNGALSSALQNVTESKVVRTVRAGILRYFNETSVVQILKQRSFFPHLYEFIKQQHLEMEEWAPKPITELQERLSVAMKILVLQREATIMPDKQFLFLAPEEKITLLLTPWMGKDKII